MGEAWESINPEHGISRRSFLAGLTGAGVSLAASQTGLGY